MRGGCGSAEGGPPAREMGGWSGGWWVVDTIIASLEQNNNNNAIRYSVCARTCGSWMLSRTWDGRADFSGVDNLHGGFCCTASRTDCLELRRCCCNVFVSFFFFLINNQQPEHVVLSACRMFWQRTWWVGMQCCHSVPKSINCANTKRHTTRQRRQGSTQQSSPRSLRRCCLRQ